MELLEWLRGPPDHNIWPPGFSCSLLELVELDRLLERLLTFPDIRGLSLSLPLPPLPLRLRRRLNPRLCPPPPPPPPPSSVAPSPLPRAA